MAGGTLVVARQSLDADGTVTTVHPGGGTERTIASFAEPPRLEPRITLHAAGERALWTALLLPSWHRPGTPLPVLMDPYGGPHAQRVVAARGAHLTSQWFAEQGFAVVVVVAVAVGVTFLRAVVEELVRFCVLFRTVSACAGAAPKLTRLAMTRLPIQKFDFRSTGDPWL